MRFLLKYFKAVLNQFGFTLIELVVILIILGIMASVALIKFGTSHSEIQYESIINKIASDVRYAQQLAMSEGTGTRVYIDQANNQYYLKWDDGTYIENLAGGGDFIVQLGQGDFSEVVISSTAFTSGRLDFNTNGCPLNQGSDFSGSLNLVTINNTKKIVITANTGLLTIQDL